MQENLVIVVAFLLGILAGGVLVGLLHRANFVRARQEFEADLQARLQSEIASRMWDDPKKPTPITRSVA